MTIRVAALVEPFWHTVPGGTATAANEILRRLATDPSVEITGFAARHRFGKLRGAPPDRFELPAETVHAQLPRPLLYEAWHRMGRPSVEGVTGPVDVVWSTAIVAPSSEAPLVVTVHDVEFLEHPEWLSRRGRSFFPVAWRATLDRAAKIVVPVPSVAEQCERHGADPSQIEVVPLGVNPVRFATADEVAELRQRHDLPERFVLWDGTQEPRKNLPGLVRAMEMVPDVPLVVVGPAGWSLDAPEVFEPLGDRAVILGRVSDADLNTLYCAAAVFAMPSLAEGFGLPVLEAMARRAPVVTSLGTTTAEVAGNAALLVEPRDRTEIAGAINRLLGDETLADELRRQGETRAAEFTWDATASAYARVLADVAGRRNAGAPGGG